MASALTPSNLIHITLDVIQLVAMVLSALQWREGGRICAAGETVVCLTGGRELVSGLCECECVCKYWLYLMLVCTHVC